jgi:hypothetical protein
MAASEQEDFLHETLAGVIRNAFFDARNAGETMYKASEDAAARVLSVLLPSSMRLQAEVDKLLAQWEKDRNTYPTNDDWQARVADAVLSLCITELRTAIEHAKPLKLELESVPEKG